MWAVAVAGISGSWLLGTVTVVCALSAFDDCRRGKIPNSVVSVGAAAVFLQMGVMLAGGDVARVQAGMVAMAAAFVVYSAAGLAGQLGMGDVKLLTFVLVPCWTVGPHITDRFDPLYAMSFLLVLHLTISFGGVLSIAAAARGSRKAVIMGPAFLFAHVTAVLLLAAPA